MVELKNKTILLTGASGGIGFEIAKLIANENCRLALLARRKEKLGHLAESLKDKPAEIITIKCDVSNKKEIQTSIKEIKDKFGKIDIAILNAGTSSRKGVEDFDSTEAEQIFAVNVFGIIYFAEALIPDFIKNKDGMIVGVSSLADNRGFPKSGFYSASKTAATKLLESLRIEMKQYNVKVLTVKPGFIKTPMTDKNEFAMPLLMEPEKAAKIILKGIKKEKRIIQFPVPTVIGSKFIGIIPDFIFEFFAKKHLESLNK